MRDRPNVYTDEKEIKFPKNSNKTQLQFGLIAINCAYSYLLWPVNAVVKKQLHG